MFRQQRYSLKNYDQKRYALGIIPENGRNIIWKDDLVRYKQIQISAWWPLNPIMAANAVIEWL